MLSFSVAPGASVLTSSSSLERHPRHQHGEGCVSLRMATGQRRQGTWQGTWWGTRATVACHNCPLHTASATLWPCAMSAQTKKTGEQCKSHMHATSNLTDESCFDLLESFCKLSISSESITALILISFPWSQRMLMYCPSYPAKR